MVSQRTKRRTGKRSRNVNKHSVVKGKGEKLLRARYFQVFRPERTMLSVIENSYSQHHDRHQYRSIRYLYYVVTPHLARNLWDFPPDRVRLLNAEYHLYEQLLSYHFYKKMFWEPSRLTIHPSRSIT